jgi:hypothetical protein
VSCIHELQLLVLTSNEQRPAARWQVQEDVFQPTRAVGEQVAEALDVDGRRNVLVNRLVCHFAYVLSVKKLEGSLPGWWTTFCVPPLVGGLVG